MRSGKTATEEKFVNEEIERTKVIRDSEKEVSQIIHLVRTEKDEDFLKLNITNILLGFASKVSKVPDQDN